MALLVAEVPPLDSLSDLRSGHICGFLARASRAGLHGGLESHLLGGLVHETQPDLPLDPRNGAWDVSTLGA